MTEEKGPKIDNLSEDQISDYRSVFELIKQGRAEKENNTLTLQMMADAMRMLGLNPKEEELQDIINTIEIEGKGNIEFEHFVEIMEHHRIPDEGEAFRQAFYVFDSDNRGFIDSQELRDVMQYMKVDKELNDHELQDMVHFFGIDVDRKIEYEEFRSFISANVDLQDIEDYEREAEKGSDEDDDFDDDEYSKPTKPMLDTGASQSENAIDANQNYELEIMEHAEREQMMTDFEHEASQPSTSYHTTSRV